MLNTLLTLSFKEHLFFEGLCAFMGIRGGGNQLFFSQIPYSKGADCHRIYRDELPKRKIGGGIRGIYHTSQKHCCLNGLSILTWSDTFCLVTVSLLIISYFSVWKEPCNIQAQPVSWRHERNAILSGRSTVKIITKLKIIHLKAYIA